MIAKPSYPVRSANAGEFSPDTAGRVDIKQYYSAGLAFKNIEPVPQGGFRRMGGSRRVGRWRRPLVAAAITGAAASGSIPVGTWTVWSGSVAATIAAVFVEGFNAPNVAFRVELQTAGGIWSPIGGTFPALSAVRSRLAAFPPRASRAGTALRIVAVNATSSAVPMSLGTVTAFAEDGTATRPRHCALNTDEGQRIVAYFSAGIVDFFTADGHVGAARLPSLAEAMLPELDTYAEARTIGVFCEGTFRPQRIFLATPGALNDWRVDDWPFDPVPQADLGADYPKTADIWELFLRWSDGPNPFIFLTLTVNGETTPAVRLEHAGDAVAVGDASNADWLAFAAAVQAALVDLSSLGAGLTVAYSDPAGSRNAMLKITFGGALSGEEYAVSAQIVNTTDASVLPYHTQIGTTQQEDLVSTLRGWPGTVELVQDRFSFGRIPAVPGAVALSRAGEYFDFNVKGQGDAAARLDKLRSQTSEKVICIKESKYLLVLTDRGVYFANNRTIERNTPLNFVLAVETGGQPNCKAFDLEGMVYYVARDENDPSGGHQLLSLAYDDVSTSYNANPESLLASHLVVKVARSVRQKKSGDLDAAKAWLMRSDGRLVAGQMIKSQEIVGFCEWRAAASGLVREIGIDGANKLWLGVERGSEQTIEIYDPSITLQDAVSVSPNLAGVVSSLPYPDGTELWAVADGYTLGPFTVANAAIDLGDSYTAALVGRWIAPRWESMPQVLVTRDDAVVLRPGRIHTAQLNILDTDSIAVGANGEEPQDISLLESTDPADAPPPKKSKKLTVSGEDLLGFKEGTTLVVTQKRPGDLRVRDLAMGVKL